MIQFFRKLFGLDARVPADAPVDMHIVLDPVEEAPAPVKAKPVAKTTKPAAKKKTAAPKKEKTVKVEKTTAKRGRPKKA